MSYRTFASGAGGMIATAGAPALVAALGRTREAYAATGAALGAVIALTMLIATWASGRARRTEPTAMRYPAGAWIGSIFASRPLAALLAAKLLVYFAISITAGLGLFFMTAALGRGEAGQALFGGLMNGTTLVILPLLVRLARGRPKRRMLAAATALYGLATLSWFVATPVEPTVLFVVRSILVGVGYAGIVLMVLSMLPDVIAHDFDRTGLRREGMLSAIFAFVEKLAYALTPLCTGLVLKLTGYVQGSAQQPDGAVLGIRLGMAVLPALLAAGSIACLRFYRLDPAAVRTP
jgi:GPH family glycoside/pentoside/hexuronide:cation symporter